MKKLSAFLFVVLVLSGCMSPLAAIPVAPQSYQVDYDRLWNAIVDSLDELGWTPAQMQKAEGFITTEKRAFAGITFGAQKPVTFGEAFAISASGALPGDERERIKISIRISKENEMSVVKITPLC